VSGPGPTLQLGAGPPNIWPGPQTFRVGPGRTSGHGPLALPVDSLARSNLGFPEKSSKIGAAAPFLCFVASEEAYNSTYIYYATTQDTYKLSTWKVLL
jgi:hypothetical protein